MGNTKIGRDVSIKSDGTITRIYIDGKEIEDIKSYSLSDDAINRQAILHLDIYVDKLNVQVLGAIVGKKTSVTTI